MIPGDIYTCGTSEANLCHIFKVSHLLQTCQTCVRMSFPLLWWRKRSQHTDGAHAWCVRVCVGQELEYTSENITDSQCVHAAWGSKREREKNILIERVCHSDIVSNAPFHSTLILFSLLFGPLRSCHLLATRHFTFINRHVCEKGLKKLYSTRKKND